MRFVDFLKRQRPSLIVFSALVLVTILGFADYVTGPEIFFLQFYLIPILLVGWFVGEAAAAGILAASAIFWFIDEVVGRAPHSQPSVVYLNIGAKILLFLVFNRMVLALKASLEREKLAAEEWNRRELEIAHEVQERLLPQSGPPMTTLDYVGICKPVFGVGGDYYDFIPLEERKLAIAVGDVSGKGISSALLMAMLKGMLHSHALHRKNEVAALIRDLNRYMYSFTDSKRFVTFFYGLYDDESRTLRYVNAGHNPPLIFRDGKKCALRLEPTASVIGLFPQAEYAERTAQLYPGDTLVCFTDGVTEAMNVTEEEFGEDRLIQIVNNNGYESACGLRDLILSEVSRFAGNAVQHDDETLVVARIL
jgi:phosphoserine phosphatase RsbU/P